MNDRDNGYGFDSVGSEKSAFCRSVAEYSADDVIKVREKKKSNALSITIECILVAVCIAIFGYSVTEIAFRVVETRANSEEYTDIRASAASDPEVKRSSSLPEPTPLLSLTEAMGTGENSNYYIGDVESINDIERRYKTYRNFLNIKSKYENTYAWIYVDNTSGVVDYPVMKCDDNGYYLTHSYSGAESRNGAIFADCGMSDDYDTNLNNLIYGHNMKDGSMFRRLKTFLEQANRNALAKTMRIEIYTEKGLYVYNILSAYRDSNFTFTRTMFADSDEYYAYLKSIVSKNMLTTKFKYNADSRICTLVTCANITNDEDERYVMHGILTTFIPASKLG